MANFEEFSRGLTIGSALGLALGVIGTRWYRNKQNLSPDAILNKVKHSFTNEGPIEGSWISFETKPMQRFAINIETVEGGITRIEDGTLVAYEFLADAKTGTVLSINRAQQESYALD
ncbi:hypothetical protein [Enterococcus alishanensis]|uniref:PepSY domain-containing protein n=1 Tax=Enterococcus alishanensis TaxID=1303817 RepID=A0ABS6TE69_9ENTE|nr:hypothetical protein [Enterococcus alishanensis]MBV7391205.1 hypothetical protein [Enterococcus alishanensis]